MNMPGMTHYGIFSPALASTPTPSTLEAWRRLAVLTTSSTRRRSAGRKTGRSPRAVR